MSARPSSRDPLEWADATRKARATREQVAREVAERLRDRIAVQAAELIVTGDVMGGRSMLAMRIDGIMAAERTGDRALVRAAVMDLIAAGGAWVAALDYVAP